MTALPPLLTRVVLRDVKAVLVAKVEIDGVEKEYVLGELREASEDDGGRELTLRVVRPPE